MRISINLATRPFVELRPLFLRLRVLMGLLAAIAIALGIWAHVMQKRLDRATAQMDALSNQTTAAQQERIHNEQRMRQPPNAAVLDRAHFLNRLFLEKSFSWTAVMMDLENVLPAGVQVTSIEPQATPSGDVIIRLRVSGERDRAVQLVRNLEHSRRFLQPRLSGEASQAKEGNANAQRAGQFRQPQMNIPTAPPGVEFDILANYNPLPESESYTRPSTAKHTTTRAAAARRRIR
jgi:type IV pilus assembly protein PilN